MSERSVVLGMAPGPAPLLNTLAMLVASVMPAQAQTIVDLPRADWAGAQGFTNITYVRPMASGIIVADRDEKRLTFLPWEGEGSTIGRTGNGPGEYRGIGALVPLAGDSTLMVDAYHGRWNLLAGTKIVETVAQQDPFVSAFRRYFGGADRLGHVLARMPKTLSGAAPMAAPDSFLLVLGDRERRTIDTIARLRGIGSSGATVLPATGRMPRAIVGNNPLATGDQAILLEDGWVAVVHAYPYRVSWRNADGGWRLGPVFEDAAPMTRGAQCAAIRQMFGGVRPCEPDDFPGWPDAVPPFLESERRRAVFPSGDGGVVVERLRLEEGARQYDVIGRDGIRRLILRMGSDRRLVGISGDRVYTAVLGDLDVQRLEGHPRPW